MLVWFPNDTHVFSPGNIHTLPLSYNLVQLSTDLMVRPPFEGEESYPLYKKERDAIMGSLKRKSEMLVAGMLTGWLLLLKKSQEREG